MSALSPILAALYEGDRERAEDLCAGHELDVFEAAALDKAARLRELLADDPGLAQAWSPDGFTPLHYAAFFGGAESVRVLVEHGADIEAPARNQEFALQARPLHSATAARRRDTVEALLDAGADPNARQHAGLTPLMEAEAADDRELADLLARRVQKS
jgi:uncharacterized protein